MSCIHALSVRIFNNGHMRGEMHAAHMYCMHKAHVFHVKRHIGIFCANAQRFAHMLQLKQNS